MQKIKNICLSLFFLTTFAYRAIGQCPTDAILYFSSQADIDAFLVEYPNCTEYQGDVVLYSFLNTSINNLQGFQNLISISGNLIINGLISLPNMSGLENLTSIGGNFEIGYNEGLMSLNGLDNLSSIGGNFKILSNWELTTINGLNKLATIGGGFEIKNNDSLTSISGLEELTTVNNIWVESNPSLTSINAWEHLTLIQGSYWVKENPALVSINDLENLTSIGGGLLIQNNGALTSMGDLNNLTSIGESFNIYSNGALTSLGGLHSLTSTKGFNVISNTTLTSIGSLENLTSIDGDFRISNNALEIISGFENLTLIEGNFNISSTAALTSMSGFENLTSIGGYFYIGNTYALNNLSGLENLTSIGGSFSIRDNTALSSMSGLENLTSIGGYLFIDSNTALTCISSLENLTSIGGYFKISSNFALGSMSGLENLTSIGEYIYFAYNTVLNSISGLKNVNAIEYLYIGYNPALNSISGLENLTSIGENVRIHYNNALTSISGLQNLASIGGYLQFRNNPALSSISGLENLVSIGEYLDIGDNAALNNISGLENLISIGEDFTIDNNDALGSLGDFENLTSIGGDLNIQENSNLSLCDASFICDYLINGNGTVSIYYNASGCDSESEILFQCGDFGKISLHFYYDENQNATQDNNEAHLSMMSATITPGDYALAGNPNGAAIKYLYYGDYIVTINEAPLWNLTTVNPSYNITLDSTNTSDTLYFGFFPNTFISNLSTTYVSSLPRCNEYVLFEPMLINNGTTIADGILWFETDENILDVNFIDVPDTIVGTNKYGWFFTDLYPQQVFKKAISLQLPGPPAFPIGDEINVITSAIYADQNNSEAFVIDNVHRVEIQCSFDPNDKLVQTSNTDNNYALIGEDLIYTIRFQNTGNAEAYDVVIKDLLSEDLDLSTFRVIASSHDTILSTYLNDRMLTFEFRDIFLPDSTTNFEASQGYVMYSIRALDTLAGFSTINNTAHIFFDYNPAVITNATENVMVESFDVDGDGFVFWVDCDDDNAFVNSNAAEIPYNGIDEDCNATTLDDDLDQDGFVLADDCDDNNALINPNAMEISYNGMDDDCNTATLDDDLDLDGFLLADDCDDNNAAINFNATEIPYNGIDEDCNTASLDDDLDQDGFLLAEDCDDDNNLINSTATEIPNNSIDEDCNGTDLIINSTEDFLTIQPQVLPNPTSGMFKIVLPVLASTELDILDHAGTRILRRAFERETEVDLSGFPQGVYVLLMKMEGNVWVERIIKL